MSLAVLLFAAGCVTRSLAIKTDPPGAKVYLNDALIGESPLTHDFVWYGWHRVMIRKEGFERLDDRRLLRAPVYLWMPFDLAMELVPLRIRDRRTWSYTLTPTQTPPTPQPPSDDSTQHTADSTQTTVVGDAEREQPPTEDTNAIR